MYLKLINIEIWTIKEKGRVKGFMGNIKIPFKWKFLHFLFVKEESGYRTNFSRWPK